MGNEEKATENKGDIVRRLGRIGDCVIIEKTTPEGKVTRGATCGSAEARNALADILEGKLLLEVDPKVILAEPPAAPVTPEPDARLNPTES
ncbi:hypothetical protein ES705_41138 [subsurface metagenome]